MALAWQGVDLTRWVELYAVQRLLGHKSPIMTQRYAHHYPESLRDGVETLDRPRSGHNTQFAQPAGLKRCK